MNVLECESEVVDLSFINRFESISIPLPFRT
jgi:hypothetical protein